MLSADWRRRNEAGPTAMSMITVVFDAPRFSHRFVAEVNEDDEYAHTVRTREAAAKRARLPLASYHTPRPDVAAKSRSRDPTQQ